MAWSIELSSRARKDLAALDRPVQRRIARAITMLESDPRPQASRALSGADSEIRRLRVGDHRILYEVRDAVLLVLIIKIGHRREVYRHIP